jgi:predicted ribosome quality control (RQC) complex YloA/Tae2 family protein
MKKSIEEFKIKRSRYTEAGKAIMADVSRIDGIIRQMSRSFSSSGKIDKGQIYSGFRVKSFDPAKRIVTLEASGQEFELNLDRTAGQNASDYFARSKEFKSKIEGAMKAIEDTDRAVMKQAQPVKKARRREWFETYHWFVSSEGFLVIAGRDAKSNEKIVKRHLKDHDIYVHAEVYGAPSTVIKVEGENQPGDSTLREACNFSVAFSRAWSAGLSSGTAYWVLPSQVSKTPESGEFVTTGSWIVRGKRNYYFDLPMDLYISMYESRGTMIPMIHPTFPEGKNGDRNVHIVPGDMKRQQVAGEIAKRLGIEKEEIEGILPPGGSRVVD